MKWVKYLILFRFSRKLIVLLKNIFLDILFVLTVDIPIFAGTSGELKVRFIKET